jgi:predicted RNA polymerase sigma factor
MKVKQPLRGTRSAVRLALLVADSPVAAPKAHALVSLLAFWLHTQATDPTTTDWATILDLYDELMELNPSGVVAPNRIVALEKVHGAGCALAELAQIENDPALRDYYFLPATKGTLLAKKGDFSGAANFFAVAVQRPCTEPEGRFLTRRMNECREQALRLPKLS